MSVRWVGAQRYVLGGDIDGKVVLRSLMGVPHLYALGPRVGVSGEITVFDGTPGIARVIDGRIRLEDSADHAACFLVWDHVETWHVTFHVLDKRDGLPHTPERHEQAKVRFQIDGCAVEVLGFYSTRHRGAFTPTERADGRRSRVWPRGTDHRRAGGRHRGAAEGDTMKLGAC